MSILRGGSSLPQIIVMMLSSLFVVFGTMPVHEFAHALAADKLGDSTPRYNGRLTLNPFHHIDYLGALMILLVGVGFAKPVPVNQRNFNHPKRDMAIVGFAGPLSNIIMALLLLLLRYGALVGSYYASSAVLSYISYFLFYAAYINISLAAFNLIPVPPLDGSRVLFALTPDSFYYRVQQYERYIYFAVLALAFIGALDGPIAAVSGWIYSGLDFVAAMPFRAAGFIFSGATI